MKKGGQIQPFAQGGFDGGFGVNPPHSEDHVAALHGFGQGILKCSLILSAFCQMVQLYAEQGQLPFQDAGQGALLAPQAGGRQAEYLGYHG